jgi:hypothetical protein
VAEETVEGVRNAEDGACRDWDARYNKTLLVDVARRAAKEHQGSCFVEDRKIRDGAGPGQ